MPTIKLTAKLRSEIYQQARKQVNGAAPLFEVGFRKYDSYPLTMNMRIWERNGEEYEMGCYDLDFLRLSNLREIELDTEGLCTLDLYATTGTGYNRELETNVYVTVSAEGVVAVSAV